MITLFQSAAARPGLALIPGLILLAISGSGCHFYPYGPAPGGPGYYAEDYTVRVRVHDYIGEVHDPRGRHLYRVEVHHGGHTYALFLHQPLPELASMAGSHVEIIASGPDRRWRTLSVHGRGARIHDTIHLRHGD